MKTKIETCPKCGSKSANFKNPRFDGDFCLSCKFQWDHRNPPIESRLTVEPKIFRALECLRLGKQMTEDNRARFSETGECFTDRILIDYWDRQIAAFKTAIEGLES